MLLALLLLWHTIIHLIGFTGYRSVLLSWTFMKVWCVEFRALSASDHAVLSFRTIPQSGSLPACPYAFIQSPFTCYEPRGAFQFQNRTESNGYEQWNVGCSVTCCEYCFPPPYLSVSTPTPCFKHFCKLHHWNKAMWTITILADGKQLILNLGFQEVIENLYS